MHEYSLMYIVQMNGAPQRCLTGAVTTGKQKRNILKYILLSLLVVGITFSANAQYTRKELRKLRKGKLGVDTSFVYQLPFAPGTAHFVPQGYYGRFSHQGRLAVDFKMPRGTNVYAARGGIVVRVRENGKKGGWNKKYRSEGNNIVIQHEDGTRAGYWHLQFEGALVNVGDTIKQGQLIGLSGKTGYTTAPHLHFIVWKFNRDGGWEQVPTRFKTSKGIKYIRAWHTYRAEKIRD